MNSTKFIQIFRLVSIEEESLSSYSSIRSNQQANKIKNYFIQLFTLFNDPDFIADNYKIIFNRHYISDPRIQNS